MVSLTRSLALPSSRLRPTMELVSGTVPTPSTSLTAGSNTSPTMLMTPMATLPRSPTTALPSTLMLLSELATVLLAMPSPAPLLSLIPLLSPTPLLLPTLLLLLILLLLHLTVLSAMVSVSVMVVPSLDKSQQQY